MEIAFRFFELCSFYLLTERNASGRLKLNMFNSLKSFLDAILFPLLMAYLGIVVLAPLPLLCLLQRHQERLKVGGTILISVVFIALCMPAVGCFGAGFLPIMCFSAGALPHIFSIGKFRILVLLKAMLLMMGIPFLLLFISKTPLKIAEIPLIVFESIILLSGIVGGILAYVTRPKS